MFPTLMLFLLENVPVVSFYIASNWLSFLEATVVYVCATAVVLVLVYLIAKRVSYLSLIFGFFIIGSGVLSIIWRNPELLIIGDTIYFTFAGVCIWWSLTWKKTVLEYLFGGQFAISALGWRVLSTNWIVVFLLAALSNEVVRYLATPEWWIGFQFWRGVAITLFAVAQFWVTRHYRDPKYSNTWGIRITPQTTGNSSVAE